VEYSFTLKYQLSEEDCAPDEIVERLGSDGCDDALVGTGQPGRLALQFTRDADDAQSAMVSALGDVRRTIPTASLIEASPDFVGLTDVAQVVGVSRQNMRNLMVNHATSFPRPVHEGSASVWHLADVLSWLQTNVGYPLEKAVYEVAITAMQINLTTQARRIKPHISREIRRFMK